MNRPYKNSFLQDEGWKLNRALYYQEGWLATANMKGVVGVTFTTSHCNEEEGLAGAGATEAAGGAAISAPMAQPPPPGSYFEPPSRTNYNLRGHRSEVRTC